MFGLASGIYQSYFAPPKLSILIVGVDGAGKTSLLERVKVTKVDTKLDIGSSSTSSLSPQPSRGSQLESLRARYAKGAVAMTSAVVGEGGGTSAEGDGNDHAEGAKASVKKSGYLNNVVGGTPARLPPPLPPRKAAKSRQWVEEIIKISSGETTNTTSENATGESNAATKTKVTGKDILDMVPPPPLFGDDMKRPSNAAATETRVTATKSTNPQPKKPPLPSKATTAAANKLVRTNTPISPSKTSTFIQFLRCPSPQSYSSAALGEEDEYDGDVESSSFAPTVSTTASKEPASAMEEENDDDDNTDSIDHLRNYYINFQENEQFDMNTYNNLKRNNPVKMFPLDKIRPTLGQNLAKLDMSGCKCSLFDLSGSEKMRPLWDRYYADTDAIIYVVNSSDTCFSNLLQSRREFEKMCNNEVLKRRIESGLPILIFANKLDMAYREYDLSVQRANNKDGGENGNSTSCSRGISWNPDEEDNFVGGDKKSEHSTDSDSCAINDISQRVVNFNDLVALFGLQSLSPQPAMNRDSSGGGGGGDSNLHAGSNVEGNIFLFGGSAKTGEGVRAAMEYLVAYSKRFHLDKQPRQ